MCNHICEVLGIGIIQLSDVTQINKRGMFPARVADDKRYLLLGNTRKLKFIYEFESVFM